MICFIIRKKFPIGLYRLIQSLWGSWWQTYMNGDIIQEGEVIFYIIDFTFLLKLLKFLTAISNKGKLSVLNRIVPPSINNFSKIPK